MTKKEAEDYFSAWKAGYEAGYQDGADFMKTMLIGDRCYKAALEPFRNKPPKSAQSSPPEKPGQDD